MIKTIQKGVFDKNEKKLKEYLNNIYKINEQMIRLVSDVLSTLRLESENALIKKETISVASLFQDTLILVGAAAEYRKESLQIPTDHRTLTIETDPRDIKSNSWDASFQCY